MTCRTTIVLTSLCLLVAPWSGCEDPADDDATTDDDTTGDDDDTTGDDDDSTTDDDDDASPTGWLTTIDNGFDLDGQPWHGAGANIHDTRSCWACSYSQPDVDEVKRRLDELIDVWGADFVRLDLESYGEQSPYMVQWLGVLDDPDYLDDVIEIVDHIGGKPGVFVELSLWIDPTFSSLGWPTADTQEIWALLAETFRDDAHVLYGLCNEPENNWDGSDDPAVWQAMDDAVAAIREVEDTYGTPHHVVAVQGTGAWARRLDYYVDHPITAGGGENVAYEIHVYDAESEFQSMLVDPAATLPVIIGEYGPADGYMTDADSLALMELADSLGIPNLAWTFHMACPPNLLQDLSGGGCGVGMDLEPSAWGELLIDHLN